MSKTCFLFGNRDIDEEIIPLLDEAIERHYTQYGARTFVVGHRGSFDRMASIALISAKAIHPDMVLLRLIAYHPSENTAAVPVGFDSAFYPMGMEKVPRQLAIVAANRKTVDAADSIICAVRYIGNCRNLLEYAGKRKTGSEMIIENLCENRTK